MREIVRRNSVPNKYMREIVRRKSVPYKHMREIVRRKIVPYKHMREIVWRKSVPFTYEGEPPDSTVRHKSAFSWQLIFSSKLFSVARQVKKIKQTCFIIRIFRR
jgi:hypothetical protein